MLAGHWSQSMPEPAPLGHTESKEGKQADNQAHKKPCEMSRLQAFSENDHKPL